MKKLTGQTPDLIEKNKEKLQALAELFPQVVTEREGEDGVPTRSIDFDLLRQALSDSLVEGSDERYRLDWPGKRASLLKANTPIAKTLRPDRASSVDFDTTENVFIEGDNFEALKILQESYLGKVKMIYIDPPYNTGKDFVYSDNFTQDKADYDEEIEAVDEEGNKMFRENSRTNPRFHSDWLSMMYERLIIARDLLRDDGVIFISIDDNEVHNLRKICDEIFGEENFEGHIHWRRRHNQPNDRTKLIGLVAEHIIVYAKSSQGLKKQGVGKLPLTGKFSNPDNDPRGDWASKPWKVGSDQSGSKYLIKSPTDIEFNEEWMGEEATYLDLLNDNRIIFSDNGNGLPRKKYFEHERRDEGQCATNWWPHELFGHNQEGNSEMTELFEGRKNLFSNPKNTRLLESIIQLSNVQQGDVVLDFFAGSASTAHALFKKNVSDVTNVKFILVQLPDDLDESIKSADSNAKKIMRNAIDYLDSINKPHLISELSKERIRRAAAMIKIDYADKLTERETPLDTGFRAYTVADTAFLDVERHPSELEQGQLLELANNIKNDRTPEDLLTQVMLELGLTLDLPIETKQVGDNTVFYVAHNALVACFDESIPTTLIDEMAKCQPLQVAFKDASFGSDDALINAETHLKRLSPDTILSVI